MCSGSGWSPVLKFVPIMSFLPFSRRADFHDVQRRGVTPVGPREIGTLVVGLADTPLDVATT